MPACPTMSTTWPAPPRACCQQCSRKVASSSRPTRGAISIPPCAALKRPSTRRASSRRQACTGFSIPLMECLPRSVREKALPSRRRVADAITISPGLASASRRAARFGVSPTARPASAPPSEESSPTTTGPVARPMRTARVRAEGMAFTASMMSSAERTARSAESS